MNRKAVLLLVASAGLALAVWALRGRGDPAAAPEPAPGQRTEVVPAPRVAEPSTAPPTGREEVVTPPGRRPLLGIRGRVEWQDGVAVPGATVRSTAEEAPDHSKPTATASPRGAFHLWFPAPFEGELIAELGGLRSPPVHVAGDSGELQGVVLRLDGQPTLRGVLVDPQGRATRGAVLIEAADGAALPGLGTSPRRRAPDEPGAARGDEVFYVVQVGEDGLFRGAVEPGVRVRMMGRASAHARSDVLTVELPEGGIDVTVSLVEELDVVGEVVRSDGRPWVGVSLWVLDERESLQFVEPAGVHRAATDRVGRFMLAGVPGLPSVELMVARDDSAQVHVRRRVDPRAEPLRLVVDDAELADASLRVDVIAADGARLDRFQVMAFRRGEDGRDWPTAVDSTDNGFATLSGFAPGVQVAVAVRVDGRVLAVQRGAYQAGKNRATIRVELPGVLRVRAPGAQRVELVGPGTFPGTLERGLDDGIALWEGMMPGEYRIRADFGGGEEVDARATVLPGRTTEADVARDR